MTDATNGPGREPCRASVDVVQTLPVPDDAIRVQCVCCRQTHYIAPALRSLLRAPITGPGQLGPCHCPPDECQAPVIMGQQTECLRAAPPAAPPAPAADAFARVHAYVHGKADTLAADDARIVFADAERDSLVADLGDWIASFPHNAPLRLCIHRALDLIEQQARELADERKLSAELFRSRREHKERADRLDSDRDALAEKLRAAEALRRATWPLLDDKEKLCAAYDAACAKAAP